MRLKSPFPWFGGKSKVAPQVWERFGDVPNYVEPFAGSLAVLLGRPHAGRVETVNDLDCYLANFWRAVRADPEAVAEWADWPVNEADLHARHQWLVNREEFRERMKTDPDWYDPKIAGWWVWGICQWIGSGWCVRPDWRGRGSATRGRGIHQTEQKRPNLNRGGRGVHGKPWQQRPHLNGDSGAVGMGIHATGKIGGIHEWFEALQERLRYVRVCCGDWRRVVGPSPTTNIGVTGVFLDPPYDMRVVSSASSGRDGSAPTDKLYSFHDNDTSARVREWAIANGDNPRLRIALCGYEGEHNVPASWECVRWKANGGYGNQGKGTPGKENAERERIWFSPHCLKPASLETIEPWPDDRPAPIGFELEQSLLFVEEG